MGRNFSPSVRACKALLISLGFLASILWANESLAATAFVVRPPASWVRSVGFKTESRTDSGSASSTFLLDDHQFRVTGKTVERYFHHAQEIGTPAGLSDLSQLRLSFEPSYQKLAIHFIRIHRDGGLINALKPSEIKIIQQEQELNQQLYNGTLAALVFLNDLRVGDVVDYAYTVTGENPVLGGRFAESFYLADRQPIQHLRFSLLWPSNRKVEIKNVNIDLSPSVTSLGSETEYVWERRDIPAISVEDRTPDWFDPYPIVDLSEFQTWRDVVQWALPMYDPKAATPPELTAEIEKWKTGFETPEQRTIAALRFVQDEVRYLGIELGRYSHQPTSPAKVFARRFGDCKDKSLLLATMLNAMGVEASPALVHSSEGRYLDSHQPSPFAFDHVIVQARLGEKTYWLDPTISYQRGTLDKYYEPSYGHALVLKEGASELEKIPLPSIKSGSVSVIEKYEGVSSGPISLQITTTNHGLDADNMRSFLSGYSLEELSKLYLNYYGDESPSIKVARLPEISDDPVANVIVVKEHYIINEFWKDKKHFFLADKINKEVATPNATQRSMPLRLAYPLSIRHVIEINLGQRFNIAEDQGSIADEALRFNYRFATQGNRIRLEYDLQTNTDSIPVAAVGPHLLVRDRVSRYVGFELTSGPALSGFSSPISSNQASLLLGLITIGILIAISVFIIRRVLRVSRLRDFGKQLKAKAGFAPETALQVVEESDIDRLLREFRCDCGQSPYNPEHAYLRERFLYDGQRLIGIRLSCSGCGRINDLYFRPLNDQPGDLKSSPAI